MADKVSLYRRQMKRSIYVRFWSRIRSARRLFGNWTRQKKNSRLSRLARKSRHRRLKSCLETIWRSGNLDYSQHLFFITFKHSNYFRYLSFRPRGSKEGHKDVVGFFLFLGEAGSTAFKTKYTLGVIGKKGNKERYFEYPGKLFGHGYGTPSMLMQDELFNLDRGYFTDGKLTLYCKVSEEYWKFISF